MSLAAYRNVWAANQARAIPSAAALVVALAVAEGTDKGTTEAPVTTRGLAARCHLSTRTVTAALEELRLSGVLARVSDGRPGMASRYRVENVGATVDNSGATVANGNTSTVANGNTSTVANEHTHLLPTPAPAVPSTVANGTTYPVYTHTPGEISRAMGREIVPPEQVPGRVAELRARLAP